MTIAIPRAIPPGARVLVTGATGFTGVALVRKLIQEGAKVAAISRDTTDPGPLRALPIEWFRGLVYDRELVQSAVRGAQWVFHLASPYREPAHDDVLRNVHVHATQLLAEAARREPGLRRFVHVSTVGVHGHIDDPPADEEYRMSPGDAYQRTKAEAEIWIRQFARETGLPLTVVRPAAIYGPGDRRLFKLFAMASRKWVPLLGSGNHLYHLIHVEDMAGFLVHAATHPAAEGEVFICGSERSWRYRDIITAIGESYGVTVRFVKLPPGPIFAAADACEFILPKLGLRPPIYRRRIAFFTKDRAFNTQKMRETVEFRTMYTDLDGLSETALWYVENGWIPRRLVKNPARVRTLAPTLMPETVSLASPGTESQADDRERAATTRE